MMKTKAFIAALLCAFACAVPVCAETAVETTSAVAEPASAEIIETADTDAGQTTSDGRFFGGLLMVGAIVSASWISTLIYRGRDKTKYL